MPTFFFESFSTTGYKSTGKRGPLEEGPHLTEETNGYQSNNSKPFVQS